MDVLAKSVDAGCENILQLFVDFNMLFLPGVCCVIAVVSITLKYAPPPIKAQIRSATSMCEVIPPLVKQKISDANSALDLLKTAGQDASAYTSILADMDVLAKSVDAGCENILQLFVDSNMLFLPGVCCVIAIVFALYVNNVLCCAAGCCGADMRKIKEAEDKDGKGVEFNSVSTPSATSDGFSSVS